MSSTVEPPYEQWLTLLVKNQSSILACKKLGGSVIERIRRAVFDAASDYTTKLRSIAGDIGVQLPLQSFKSFNRSQAVVMAGHQPVVYHPGLLFKNQQLSRISKDADALAINVIIDTDEGDGGRLVWPLVHDSTITLRTDSLVESEGLFASQSVTGPQRVSEIFSTMASDLRSSGLIDAARRVETVSDLYARLSSQPIAVANSIVRWAHEDRRYLEVPLSRILAIPEVRDLLYSWVKDSQGLVSCYNKTLEEFRSEHKIKNSANPFPNMKVEAETIELPFWVISATGREPA
jgi:hypothetical protein